MAVNGLTTPPLLTADLPGIGGRIKTEPDDFEVEEIPAYLPSGSGDHLYLWIEKRDMGAEYLLRQVSKRLGIATQDISTAGLKDRRAVTRQWLSLPVTVADRLTDLDGDGLRVLQVSRHSNKLKPGHLRGNRFRILIRDIAAGLEPTQILTPILDRLHQHGLPNFYGPQRFGIGGETVDIGFALLRDEPLQRRLNPFLRKLALSAAQAALFNLYLARRLQDQLLRTVLAGDVMSKWPAGGLFVAEDVPSEQQRFDARETVTTGPIFGKKTFPAQGEAAAREAAILADTNLSRDDFARFGKLLQGTRRHNLIYLDDLAFTVEPDGVRLSFSLPAGSYATVLLREIMKTEVAGEEDTAEQ